MTNFPEMITKNIVIAGSSLMVLAIFQVLFLVLPFAVWSFLAFTVFGLFVCAMAYFLPFSFILLLPYIFFRATTLVSGIAIEYGGYMKDIEMLGEPTGAYIRLTAVYIIFIFFASTIIEFVRSKKIFTRIDPVHVRERTRRHPWVWIFFAIASLFSLYVLYFGMRVGFPLIDGTDRFAFRAEKADRAFMFFIGNTMLATFLFGIIIYTCQGIRRYTAIFLFIMMVGISMLFGEKFTSVILTSIYIITPAYLMSKTLQKRILPYVIPAIGTIALLTIPIILIVYGWGENPADATEKLKNRMVSQGELWYAADKNTDEAFKFDEKAVSHIVASTVLPSGAQLVKEEPFIGAHYFMNKYQPPGMLSLFLSRPYLTLTFAFEPYLLAQFGYVGMILPLLFYSGIYGLFLSFLAWAILNARPISIIFAAKLILWAVAGLAQGYLYAIFGLRTLVLVGIALVYELTSSLLSRKSPKSL